MPAISLKIEGLEELKKSLDSNKLQKELIVGIGIIADQLHNVLNGQVKSAYATNRSLNSVLLNKTTSNLKRGVNFISSALEYKFEAINLARFPQHSAEFGNINADASKQGLVQRVTVLRKNPYKIIKGNKHYGGFVPSSGRVRSGNYAKFMFERQQKATWIGKRRAPIKYLFGPSLSQMANTQFNATKGDVARFKNRIPGLLIKYVTF